MQFNQRRGVNTNTTIGIKQLGGQLFYTYEVMNTTPRRKTFSSKKSDRKSCRYQLLRCREKVHSDFRVLTYLQVHYT